MLFLPASFRRSFPFITIWVSLPSVSAFVARYFYKKRLSARLSLRIFSVRTFFFGKKRKYPVAFASIFLF